MTFPTTDFAGDSTPLTVSDDDGEQADVFAPDNEMDAATATPDTGTEEDDTDDGVDAPAQRKARRGLDRATVRRVATKMDNLTRAPEERREILTALLGASSNDPVELTIAVMTGSRAAMTPVTDLLAVADSDPLAAGITAMSLERSRMRAVWLQRDHHAGQVEQIDQGPSARISEPLSPMPTWAATVPVVWSNAATRNEREAPRLRAPRSAFPSIASTRRPPTTPARAWVHSPRISSSRPASRRAKTLRNVDSSATRVTPSTPNRPAPASLAHSPIAVKPRAPASTAQTATATNPVTP